MTVLRNLLAAFLVMVSAIAFAQPTPPSIDQQLDGPINQLLGQLADNQAIACDNAGSVGIRSGQKKPFSKIGLLVETPAISLFPAEFVSAVDAGLRHQMNTKKAQCYELVVRDAASLRAIVDDLDRFGGRSSKRISEFFQQAKADILVRAVLTPQSSEQARLDIFASNARGVQVAVIQPATLTIVRTAKPEDPLSLELALKAMAKRMVDRSPNLDRLVIGGVLTGDTGHQAQIGKFIVDQLIPAFQEAAGKRSLIIDASGKGYHSACSVEDSGGIGNSDLKKCSYLMSGKIWPIGDQVAVTLVLQQDRKVLISDKAIIHRASFPRNISFQPEITDQAVLALDALGPIDFALRNARGDNPVYRDGELLNFQVEATRSLYMHCYYRTSDLKIMRLLPHPFQQNTQIPAGTSPFPDPRWLKLRVSAAQSTGNELLQCYALAHEYSPDLPIDGELGGFDLVRVSKIEDIYDAYARDPNLAFSVDSMAITILPN